MFGLTRRQLVLESDALELFADVSDPVFGLLAVQSRHDPYAAQLVARPIEHVAEALVEEEEASGIMQRDRAERLGQLRCCCLTAWRNAFISVRDLKW